MTGSRSACACRVAAPTTIAPFSSRIPASPANAGYRSAWRGAPAHRQHRQPAFARPRWRAVIVGRPEFRRPPRATPAGHSRRVRVSSGPLAEQETGDRRRQHRNGLVLQQRPPVRSRLSAPPFRIRGERGPGFLARFLVGEARHISEAAVFDWRGERAEQVDAMTRKELVAT